MFLDNDMWSPTDDRVCKVVGLAVMSFGGILMMAPPYRAVRPIRLLSSSCIEATHMKFEIQAAAPVLYKHVC